MTNERTTNQIKYCPRKENCDQLKINLENKIITGAKARCHYFAYCLGKTDHNFCPYKIGREN